ncbi:MAG: helix-hairpin-helix domain-containing protein [Perlabentimonas sp.]
MIKNWLNYTRAERNGIILLVFIICMVALYPYFYKSFLFKTHIVIKPSTFYVVDSFFTSLTKVEKKVQKPVFSFADEESEQDAPIELFQFNPNTVSTAQLVKLGFSKGQAAVIENYRNSGGEFNTPEDFLQVYVVDSSMFQTLEPYITFPENETILADNNTEKEKKEDSKPEPIKIELNSTDTLELTKLRGIGRGYARRIVAYRELLGGYYSTNQLEEVYGFPPDLLEKLSPQLYVDTLKISRININLTDYQNLKKHPYLTEHQARSIIYYRETIGNINKVIEIYDNKLVDKKTFNRIKYYLTLH